MKLRTLFLSWLVIGAAATTSIRAQLMDLSFDVDTRFRQDFVQTDLYFMLPEGAAHFDFRFNPQREYAGDDYVRIRVTDPDGGLVFNEHRALDRVLGPGEDGWYFLTFTEEKMDGPNDRRFYENLRLSLLLGESWVDDEEIFVPSVQIDPISELYVYGWSPMIQYVPPGHGGAFHFAEEGSNVVLRFVPVPEPSTYGFAALAMLGGAAVWRRWRAAQFRQT